MDINNHIADFQFSGKSIKELSVTNDFVNTNDSDDFSRTVDVDYEIKDISERENRKVAIMYLFVNTSVARDEKSTKIKYVVEGCFSVSSNTSDEDFITMLSVNGCTALYSIARADIVSISSHIFNSGKIVLPMVNVWELVNAKRQKD